MQRMLLILLILSLFGCLDVKDQVILDANSHLQWKVFLTAADGELPNTLPKGCVQVQLNDLHCEQIFVDTASVDSIDRLGEWGPLRQKMTWFVDSIGHTHWTRNVRIQRDMSGEDGGFADRMLGSMYKGVVWRFSAQFPGRILAVEPKPAKLDSMRGEVTWNVPLIQLVQGHFVFRAEIAPLPKNPGSEAPRYVLWIGLGVFVLTWLLAWLFRRRSMRE